MKVCIWGATLLVMVLSPLHTVAAALPEAGEYTVEVSLSGGSGRASVESPAVVTVAGDAVTAVVIWGSPYYERMLIGGNSYYPVSREGNSTFAIPIVFDENIAVTARTIAMSEPHEIDYTLRFDSSTLRPRSPGGYGARGFAAAAVLLALLGLVLLWKAARQKRQRERCVCADKP